MENISSFNAQTPSFRVTLGSGFTYNPWFEIKEFRVLDRRTNASWNVSITETEAISGDYRGFTNVHRKRVEGRVNISVTHEWRNETLVAETIAEVNGMRFLYASPFLTIDYDSMFARMHSSFPSHLTSTSLPFLLHAYHLPS